MTIKKWTPSEYRKRLHEAFWRFPTIVSVHVERWGNEQWGLVGVLNAPGRQERSIWIAGTREEARSAAREWRKWAKRRR